MNIFKESNVKSSLTDAGIEELSNILNRGNTVLITNGHENNKYKAEIKADEGYSVRIKFFKKQTRFRHFQTVEQALKYSYSDICGISWK